jgi:hypothetical protein
MLQLKEDIIRIFLWSIITVMMYGVVVYAITLALMRALLIYRYRNYKTKYFSSKSYYKQIILLSGVILYVYGACFYNFHFLGLLPMLLFFSNLLTNIGRFYIYENDRLILIEDLSNKYVITDIKMKDGKTTIRGYHIRSLDNKEMEFNSDAVEGKFLTSHLIKETKEEIVA